MNNRSLSYYTYLQPDDVAEKMEGFLEILGQNRIYMKSCRTGNTERRRRISLPHFQRDELRE